MNDRDDQLFAGERKSGELAHTQVKGQAWSSRTAFGELSVRLYFWLVSNRRVEETSGRVEWTRTGDYLVITVAGGEKEILLTSLLSQLAYHIAGEALSPMVLLIHSF